MDVKTQQIIIIILGILALASIIRGNTTILDIIVAGLIGFLGQKTLTDKQSEIIRKNTLSEMEEDDQ